MSSMDRIGSSLASRIYLYESSAKEMSIRNISSMEMEQTEKAWKMEQTEQAWHLLVENL
jgi:hypothetical protein